ncbi:TIGR04149 family rSAM-modified RiPP [Algoriphagus sp.]|uniref:TIGR04149 family rSAM-modified RiPP n=1 Tax=Algoriphagus sp. TaxID=1872435 RepID=UPI003F6F0939
MKSIKDFKNFSLSKSEMKKVIGGRMYVCECYNSVGRWTGNYSSHADAVAAGGEWCATGIAECR